MTPHLMNSPIRGKTKFEIFPILMPLKVVILEIEPVDEETENYLSVDDEDVLNAVFGIFKEKYQDILTFEE